MSYHLGAYYFEEPDGTFVSQPKKYIDKLAETYKRLFNEDPPKGYKTPLDKNDHPELDTSEILEGDMAAKYLTMVCQVQWLVTLGRFNLHAQVATISRFRAAPRQGHIDRPKRIYAYAIWTKDYAVRFRTDQPDSHSTITLYLLPLWLGSVDSSESWCATMSLNLKSESGSSSASVPFWM